MKDIVVCFDSTLSFNAHMSFIVAHALKTFGTLSSTTQKFRHPARRICLFCALVRSPLNVASVVCNSRTRTQSLSIKSEQKIMTHFVYDRRLQRRFYYAHAYLLKSALLRPLSNERFQRNLIFFCTGLQTVVLMITYFLVLSIFMILVTLPDILLHFAFNSCLNSNLYLYANLI